MYSYIIRYGLQAEKINRTDGISKIVILWQQIHSISINSFLDISYDNWLPLLHIDSARTHTYIFVFICIYDAYFMISRKSLVTRHTHTFTLHQPINIFYAAVFLCATLPHYNCSVCYINVRVRNNVSVYVRIYVSYCVLCSVQSASFIRSSFVRVEWIKPVPNLF